MDKVQQRFTAAQEKRVWDVLRDMRAVASEIADVRDLLVSPPLEYDYNDILADYEESVRIMKHILRGLPSLSEVP